MTSLKEVKPLPGAQRKLRLALFGSRGIPHTYGGGEAFLVELAPRLAARGHDVIVYCRSALFRERPKEYRGVRLIYLPNIETKALGTPTFTLVCMLDVLFRHVDAMLVLNTMNGFHCIIPRLFGKKVAIVMGGEDWKNMKWGRIARAYFYLNARWIGRICGEGVVNDAVAMQEIYLKEFNTPSTVIAYGGNIEKSEKPEVVRQYGLEPGRYYLIASRLVSKNNADLIVRAFERVHTNRLLAIAGGANFRSSFVEQLKQTKDPRVRFLGHVGDIEHVKELHCNAYAYVHGHTLGGTNPALLKALGFGNCILSLNTPFNKEVLHDYGLFFEHDADDLCRKLQYIEDNPQVAEEYRRRAPQRILEAYTWDHITDEYEKFFYRLVRGHDQGLKEGKAPQSTPS
jgi:glycosyltransferase involved in cell wall biosynthesis